MTDPARAHSTRSVRNLVVVSGRTRRVEAAFAILMTIALTAGCVGQAGTDTLGTLAGARVADWTSTTRAYDVPVGDSFIAILVNFSTSEAIMMNGKPMSFLMIDASGLGEKTFEQESWHLLGGTTAEWAGSTSTSGAGGISESGMGVKPPDPHFLIVVALHTERSGVLRIAVPKDLEQESLPVESIAGEPLARGPASVSYYIEENGIPHGFVDSHNVHSARSVPSAGGAAFVGGLTVGSDHPREGNTLEFASVTSSAPRDISAGVLETAWSSSAGSRSTKTAFVGASGAGPVQPGFVATGPSSAGSSTQMTITGAMTSSLVILEHVSVPLDLASLGYQETTYFGIFSGSIPPSQPTVVCPPVAHTVVQCVAGRG